MSALVCVTCRAVVVPDVPPYICPSCLDERRAHRAEKARTRAHALAARLSGGRR